MFSESRTALVSIGLNIFFMVAALAYFFYISRCAPSYSSPGTLGNKGSLYRVAFVEYEHTDSADLVMKGIYDASARNGQQTVDIKVFDANQDKVRLAAIIEQVVVEKFDLIVPFCSMATQLTREITRKRGCTTPIVFCGIGDPAKQGLLDADGKPIGNMTGQCVVGFVFVEPMIEQLKFFAPKAKKILIPYNPASLGGTLEEYRQHFGKELEKRGYTVSEVKVYHSNDVVQKIQPFINDVDVVWLLPDATTCDALEGIGKLCAQHKKFTYITMNLNRLGEGGALAFGYSLYDVGLDVGDYVARILVDGQKASDLPFILLSQKHLRISINVENARKQGLLEQVDPEMLYLMENGLVYKKAV